MAFATGTSSDWCDLLADLRTFLTANGWTSIAYTAGDVNAGGALLNVYGPGAGADKQAYVNIQSVLSADGSIVAWDVRGAISYISGQPFGSQPGESPPTYFSLWKSPISYWFYCNDRRFIVVAKVSTSYISLYAGFFLPWATPEEYPFPLLIAGSDGVLRAYNSTDSAHRSMVDPGGANTGTADYCGGKFRATDGTWARLVNHLSGSSAENQPTGSGSDQPITWPYGTRFGVIGSGDGPVTFFICPSSANGVTKDSGAFANMVATAQGERMLLPISLMRAVEPGAIGVYDGAYAVCGATGLTPEQVLTLGARNFDCFIAISRNNPNNFFAVEQV